MHVQMTDRGKVNDITKMLLRLDGSQVYTLILWRLPTGKSLDEISLIRDVTEYVQCVGSADRMRLDARRTKDGAPEQFVLGHVPNGGNPDQTETIYGGGIEVDVASNEVFAAAEAAEIFISYGRTGWVPSTYLLRPLRTRPQSIEGLYQEIGGQAREMAGDDLAGKFLVYAEVAEGNVFVCDFLYENRNGGVSGIAAADRLMDTVYDLWQLWQAQPGSQEWRVMSYFVDDGGKVTVELTYPDDVGADEDRGDRRQRGHEKYFGDVEIIERPKSEASVRDEAVGAMSIEQIVQAIGQEAFDVAGDNLGGNLLVYAEVEEGVRVTDLLYLNRKGEVQVVLHPERLVDLVYELWQRWDETPGDNPERWRVMEYVVDQNHHMTIHVTYADDIDEEEGIGDRRPRSISKYFGDVKVMYPPLRR